MTNRNLATLVEALKAKGFEAKDTTWHNDMMPSVRFNMADGRHVVIWINACGDPKTWEFDEDLSALTVGKSEELHQTGEYTEISIDFDTPDSEIVEMCVDLSGQSAV